MARAMRSAVAWFSEVTGGSVGASPHPTDWAQGAGRRGDEKGRRRAREGPRGEGGAVRG